MSIRRLIATAGLLALTGGALAVLTPGLGPMAAALAAAQSTVDTAGADALVLSGAGLLAWAVWSWGALGLGLTAASVVPGVVGGAAHALLEVVLPSGARRSAALALGLGLGVAGPLLSTAAPTTLTQPASATWGPPSATGTVLDRPVAPIAAPVPDWPASSAEAAAPPDWPITSEAHVVARGDCLWRIAGGRLFAQEGRQPTDREVATATAAWWQANAEVIGPDPDLLLPGQRLSPPEPT